MTEEISKQIALGLDDLPFAPPLGDLSRLYSPAELAGIAMRRPASRNLDFDHLNDIPPSALASAAGGLVPGSGIADFFGYFPDFEGGYEPSAFENVRRGNYGTAGLQTLGLAGDALYAVPAAGVPLGTGAKLPRAAQRAAKFAKYAEQYPPVGAPRLIDKASGREIRVAAQEEAEELVSQGKASWRKSLSPEAKEFARALRAIRRDMNQNGYPRYFDPAKRADVDPANYPTRWDMSVDAMPTRAETQQKYRDMYQTDEAENRLLAGYRAGESIPNATGIFHMKQLEDEYVRALGPVAGRERFKVEFADAMAATTAGNNPTANFRMAQYVNYLRKQGRDIPKSGYEMPYPIGGAFAAQNAEQARRLFKDPAAGYGAKNPKRHDYSYSILGHTDKPPVDSVISNAIVPNMRAPQHYGPASELMKIVAEGLGVEARHFQDVSRTGLQKLNHNAKPGETSGKQHAFRPDGPLIDTINESIERTHRLTGMPREEIVRRGLVLKEIPMYGVAGAAVAPLVSYGFSDTTSETN